FVVRWPGEDPARYEALLDRGFVPGLPLGRDFPELAGCTLLCATETKSRGDLDALAEAMAS
ncbi:MAG: glycine dehydrogenase, partial [Proteobacteria bacterium]|nr:glycine dehydrogenase [Pseudomonadota bacterium]